MPNKLKVPTRVSPIGDVKYAHIRYGYGFDIARMERQTRVEPRAGSYEPPAPPDVEFPQTRGFTEVEPGAFVHRTAQPGIVHENPLPKSPKEN